MADKWHDIKKAYTDANMLMGQSVHHPHTTPPRHLICPHHIRVCAGDLIKVTPSSKVVGDMAQFMVQNGVTPDNILDKADGLSVRRAVVEFFQAGTHHMPSPPPLSVSDAPLLPSCVVCQGYIGQPPFGFPEPLRTKVLKGAKPVEGRPGAHLPPVDWGHLRAGLEEKHGRKFSEADLVSSVMYPKASGQTDGPRQHRRAGRQACVSVWCVWVPHRCSTSTRSSARNSATSPCCPRHTTSWDATYAD